MNAPAAAAPNAPRRIAVRLVGIGCALGIAGLSLFAGLHALVVKPVWSQLAGGIPFVIAIGIAVTWAYHRFVQAVPRSISTTGGLRFGALMWLSAWPATAFANLLRIRLGGSWPAWADLISFALALAGGAIVLGAVTRDRGVAIAGAVASGVLLTAAGGPLPVLRGGGVAELWFGLFVLETLGGGILAQLYQRWIIPITTPAP